MPNTVTVTKTMDGSRNAVFHVFIEGGSSGDFTNEVLIDPTEDFDPALGAKPVITIEEIWYDLVGFNAKLSFGELVSNTPVLACSGNKGNHLNFERVGGLKDRSNTLDGNGKLLLSTSGIVDGYCGSMVIRIKKS